MTLSLTGRRPDFTQGIARLLSLALERIGSPRISRSQAIPAPRDTAGETDADPRQLSRAGLLAELLAPAPCFTVCEPSVAAYGNPVPDAATATVARRLAVARELICRDLREEMQGRTILDKPALVAEWLQLHCAGLDYEVFLVLYLDAQLQLITFEQLFRGTLTETSVYPREVVKGALRHQAVGVVLAHNHPSGVAEPSRADRAVTQTLKSALDLVDVGVWDHFIVAGTQHCSFSEQGLI